MNITDYQMSLVDDDYIPLLPSSDLPTVQNDPGLTSILPTLAQWIQNAADVLTTASQTSSFPSSLSYGYIQQLVSQGQTLATQIDNLSPCPYLLAAEIWDTVVSLQTLLIYPELLSA